MRIYLDEIKCRMICNGEMYDYKKNKDTCKRKKPIFLGQDREKMREIVGLFTGQY